jgi:polyvinyl alcohol dehydrogenase (cytochrome)
MRAGLCRVITFIGGTAVAFALLAPASAHAAASCSTASPGGGDWPLYGHDLSGARHQTAANGLGPSVVGHLKPAWTFWAANVGDTGNFQSTPTIAGGCAYLGSSKGQVFALNADTGALVWRTQLPIPPGEPYGIVGAAVVDAGHVLVMVNRFGSPYAAALDAATGSVQWTRVLDTQPGASIDATPVPFQGLVFAGFNANELDARWRGGYDILDEETGQVLAHRYVIPDSEAVTNVGGGSIWATAAVDPVGRYAYVGTGNPAPRGDHPRTDALLKIDLDRQRPTFGDIVGSARGEPETYFPGINDAISASCLAIKPGVDPDRANLRCLRLDLDYGASPQVFSAGGRLLAGELQKSGVYHVVDAGTMAPVWQTIVGTPCRVCNADSPATDGRAIYVEGTVPGQMVALDVATGTPLWLAPVLDGVHFQSVTVADGVVYTVDSLGFLDGWNAKNGLPLLKRPLLLDNGHDISLIGGVTSASVSVARHTLYVAMGGRLVAYRSATGLRILGLP